MIINVIRMMISALYNLVDDDGIEHSGYMAFMLLVALFPFLVFFLSLTSAIGASVAGANFIRMLLENLPDSETLVIKHRITELLNAPPQHILTVAIVGAIWTSSSCVEGLRTILNKVYKLQQVAPPYLWRRMLSICQFLMIIAAIFFVVMLLVLMPMLLSHMPFFNHFIARYDFIFIYVRYIAVYVALFGTSLSLYYVIPNTKLKLVEVVPGSMLTALLWAINWRVLGTYIHHYTQLSAIYGSLGSIIISLFFFYIINVIFVYGAELNYLIFHNKNPKVILSNTN